MEIKQGDLLKVDLGVHVDGYPVCVSHTVAVGGQSQEQQRLVSAAWQALQCVVKQFGVEMDNQKIALAIGDVCRSYGVGQVPGVLGHQVKRWIIDGNEVVLNRETFEDKSFNYRFQNGDVFCFDVILCQDEECRTEASQHRSTVFKRNIDKTYSLKSQKGRQFLNQIKSQFQMGFSLISFDEIVARIGVSAAQKHELLQEYPVIETKGKGRVAQFKWTVGLVDGKIIILGGKKKPGFELIEGKE